MRLVPITADDEDLTVRLECDPGLMLHIGGPRPEADVRAAHRRRLALNEQGQAYMYTIVDDPSGKVFGTIGLWKIEWKGPQIYEMGWFVLPEYQGQGIATEAARRLITQACSNPAIRSIHAYPAVGNGASNAIARKIGMQYRGQFDNEGFAGVMRCNDWRIDVG
jgi:RimJ/RimL family protein N-acetyltransferase